MNIISLTGNLGRDNEVKQLSSGTTVLNNSIGVRSNSKVGGEYKTSWFNISIFGKSAEIFNQYTKKGSKVFLTGEVRIRDYQKNDGTTGMSVDLIVNNFEFLDSANGNSNANSAGYQNNGQQNNYGYQNNANAGGFNNVQQQGNGFGSDPFQNGSQGRFNVSNDALEIDESDIPF